MDPLQPNSKIIFCHHGTKTPNKKRNSDLQNKRNQPFFKNDVVLFFFFLVPHLSYTVSPVVSQTYTSYS